MAFLRNAWYCAGWRDDIDRTPRARRLLGEPVVLFRGSDGSPVALADRCPHRFAPLHRGTLRGDVLQCPYHGLEFDRDGRCVRNPHGSGAIPAAAQVRKFPLLERHGVAWIWMGDPPRADPAMIPAFPELIDLEHYRFVSGSFTIKAHYETVIDNLLDLSHVDYLHPKTFVHPGAMQRARFEMSDGGGRVYATYHWQADPIFPLVDQLFQTDSGLCDTRVQMRWEAPANLWLSILSTEVGASFDGAVEFPSAHLLTPQDDGTTHYFWAAGRNRLLDVAEVDAAFRASVTTAFTEQDAPIIEAAAERMASTDLFALAPLTLTGDAAALRARRVLAQRIAAESN